MDQDTRGYYSGLHINRAGDSMTWEKASNVLLGAGEMVRVAYSSLVDDNCKGGIYFPDKDWTIICRGLV